MSRWWGEEGKRAARSDRSLKICANRPHTDFPQPPTIPTSETLRVNIYHYLVSIPMILCCQE